MNWRSDKTRAAGFTLLELLIVLAIMGMVAGLVVGGRPGRSASADLRFASETLAMGLREARAQAIAQGRPVGMLLDTRSRRFGVGKAPDRPLPDGLTLSLLTGRSDVLASGQGRIRFFPDGSSTGGRITIDSSAGKAIVGIDWLSGRVSVAGRR